MTKDQLLNHAARIGRYQDATDMLLQGKSPAQVLAIITPATGATKAAIDAGWAKAYKAASPKRDQAA
jgi:hypothetical protein